MAISLDPIKAALAARANDPAAGKIAEDLVFELERLGYTPTDEDAPGVIYSTERAIWKVLNYTNRLDLPRGLHPITVDWAVAYFLRARYSTGRLDLAGLDLTGAVASVSLGDMSVSLGGKSGDNTRQIFEAYLEALESKDREELIAYRRLKW